MSRLNGTQSGGDLAGGPLDSPRDVGTQGGSFQRGPLGGGGGGDGAAVFPSDATSDLEGLNDLVCASTQAHTHTASHIHPDFF